MSYRIQFGSFCPDLTDLRYPRVGLAVAAWMLLLAFVIEPAHAEVITLSCEFVSTSQPAMLGNEKLVNQVVVDDQRPSIVLRQAQSDGTSRGIGWVFMNGGGQTLVLSRVADRLSGAGTSALPSEAKPSLNVGFLMDQTRGRFVWMMMRTSNPITIEYQCR